MDVIQDLKDRRETVWLNPNLQSIQPREKVCGYGFVYVQAAQNRFMRFLPYIAAAFPETAAKKGVIESPLLRADRMREELNAEGYGIEGALFIKDDARMPIAGSVKARGGIHEVLKLAESILQREGLLNPTDNYAKIDTPEIRECLSKYTVQVGSTGNLGLSIGRTAARMGFRVKVHMSRDARQWKKDLLRSEGAEVIEYSGDYLQAVAAGRAQSAKDPMSHFVDDENSEDLFFGYATAAMRLKVQLMNAGVSVGERRPLFVYIPCGVGGAPGGISFGLKQMFGEHVHCFFAEPVEAPCFTLGMATGKHAGISVYDIGLTCGTIADGLAVGRPSGLACRMMDSLVSGSFTVSDDALRNYQHQCMKLEDLRLEPSACAGFHGLRRRALDAYIGARDLQARMPDAVHVVWATGGGLIPPEEQI